MDVGDFLRELGLQQYEAAFRDNRIDIRVLPKLTAEDLAWLVDSQPAVKARIASTLAERLQHR